MPQYNVDWSISVEADNPQQAAGEALEIMRDPNSIATVFLVFTKLEAWQIDLWHGTMECVPRQNLAHVVMFNDRRTSYRYFLGCFKTKRLAQWKVEQHMKAEHTDLEDYEVLQTVIEE